MRTSKVRQNVKNWIKFVNRSKSNKIKYRCAAFLFFRQHNIPGRRHCLVAQWINQFEDVEKVRCLSSSKPKILKASPEGVEFILRREKNLGEKHIFGKPTSSWEDEKKVH